MTQHLVRQLLAATRNCGKAREIQQVLTGLPIELRTLEEFPDFPPVDETGDTYEENSKIKALAYAGWTGLPALADDSGLEVEALGGTPGVLSARFGGDSATDADRVNKLLFSLQETDADFRRARFVCCMTIAGWADSEAKARAEPFVMCVSRGELTGHIAIKPSGHNGFGYDPVFIPSGYGQSLAELPVSLKNEISHRARALATMRVFLQHWATQT